MTHGGPFAGGGVAGHGGPDHDRRPDHVADQRVLATSDCEHCRPGLVSQPANTVSSLAYVVVGAAMVRSASRRVGDVDRPLDLARGAAVVAVGLGSVAYHGPGGRLGKWTHDAALVSMLLLAELRVARAMRPSTVVPLAAIAAVPAVAALVTHPRTTDPSQAIIGATTVTSQIARTIRARRTGQPVHRLSTAAIFGAAGACHALGRTGMPACRPDSLFQPHAVWHVLSAVALWRESIDLDRPTPTSPTSRQMRATSPDSP